MDTPPIISGAPRRLTALAKPGEQELLSKGKFPVCALIDSFSADLKQNLLQSVQPFLNRGGVTY